MSKSKKSGKKTAAQSASAAAETSAADRAAATESADKTAADAVKDNPAAADDKSGETDAAADSARQKSADGEKSESRAEDSSAETESRDGDSAADSSEPAAEQSAEELRDLYVRAVAENENLAKRAAAEIKKAGDFALSRFAPGICEVRDCLESALAESETDGAGDKTRTGVSLTLRKLSAVMEDNGILPVRPDIGASFDAGLHQAAGMSEGGDDARTVAKVMQCGYTLNGRLVRPAIVWLGKPPAGCENDSERAADSGADNS
ncbi:MAG: nucleotide exchange factor GrpE [Gammaproteobacteria bacterium]